MRRFTDSRFSSLYFDKIRTGFLTWSKTIKGYRPVSDGESPIVWEASSVPCLNAIKQTIIKEDYIHQLSALWAQESGKGGTSLDVRQDNVLFFKYIGNCQSTLSSHLDSHIQF